MAFEEVKYVLELAYGESVAQEESPERDAPTLTPVDRLVWAVLAYHMNAKTRLCCPSYERLMKFTGLGRTALSASVQRLKNLGWVSVERHGRANRYSWEVTDLAEALPEDEVRETNFSSSGDELQKAAKRISEVRETPSNRVLKPGRESRIESGSISSSSSDDERESNNNSNDNSNDKDSGRAPNPPVSDDHSPVKYHPDVQYLADLWKSCFKSEIDLSLVNTWYKFWGTDRLRRAFRFVSLDRNWLKAIPDVEAFDRNITLIMNAADPNTPDCAPPHKNQAPDEDVEWDTQAHSPAARPQARSGALSPTRGPVSRPKRTSPYNDRFPKDAFGGPTIPAPIKEKSYLTPQQCRFAWEKRHPPRPCDQGDFDYLLDRFDEDDILFAIAHFPAHGNWSEKIRTSKDFRDNLSEIMDDIRPPNPTLSEDE